jgi:hypothetical protein
VWSAASIRGISLLAKIIVFNLLSLDGFIADANGGLG